MLMPPRPVPRPVPIRRPQPGSIRRPILIH